MTTTAWTRAHLAGIAGRVLPELPMFGPEDCPSIRNDVWMWDFWPAECPLGRRTVVDGGELWFALSAPVLDNPDARHDVARIRKLHRVGDDWRDLGPAFADGFTPGSREWSGSAIIENGRIVLYFTVAGRRGEAVSSYEQRIFATDASIDVASGEIGEWRVPVECFASDGIVYAHAREATGTIGAIKAFRDPAWFRDPLDGAEYILFTGSIAGSASSHSGCIGIARRGADGWILLPPLVTADVLNNELERPHLRVHDGRYWLFWSTQAHVFLPDSPASPTGLYAMVAETVRGPYTPFAGTGLAACNPQAAPAQAYSWWVGADGAVFSFADRCNAVGASVFRGTLAPKFDFEPLRTDN